MKNPFFRWHFWIALFLILTVASFPSHLAFSSPAPTINSTCEPGGCTINAACDEQVYIDGSTYLYRDRTGVNQQQGTNAGTIIQAALDAIQGSNNPSGRVCLSYGAYPVSSTLNINNHGMQLTGVGGQLSGVRQTAIQCSQIGLCINVYNAGIRLQSVKLADLTIQATGAATSSATGVGLTFNTVEDPVLRDVVIRDYASGTGMNITVDATSPSSRYTAGGTYDNVHLQNNLNGIITKSADATHAVNSEDFFNLKSIGTGAAGTGVTLDRYTATTSVFGGDLESYATAYSNDGIDNKFQYTRTEVISGTHYAFTTNSLRAKLDSPTIVGGGTKVTDAGTNNQFTGWGFINSGTASISASTTVVVSHNLFGTPTSVLVTAGTTGTGVYFVGTFTSSQFTITVANSGTYTMYWTAYYQP